MTLSPCFQEKQEGIGLLELMLSLAVIAMLLIMATRYYATAHMGEQVNTAVGIVQAMTGAAAQWETGQGSYTGISLTALNNYGLVPQDIWNSGTSGSTANPWGGDVEITTTTGADLEISMSNVPATACQNLIGKLSNQSSTMPTCSSSSGAGTFTFTVS